MRGRAALQLKGMVELLESTQAMHDPVVFFDECWINALLLRHDPD